MTHPDEGTWVRLATGDLTADERDRLLDHALDCDDCAATLRAVTHVRAGAAAIDPGAPAAAAPHRFRPYLWVGLAATLVLAVGAAVAMRLVQANRPVSDRASVTAPPAGAPPPAQAAPRAWARLGEPPDVRLPAHLALAVRGADKDREALLEAFGRAIAPYRDGQYAAAADRLAPLAEQRPDVPEIAFYLGVSRLFAGDPSASVAPLRQARGSTALSNDAQWYEAIALERAGRRADADAALRTLCTSPGARQAEACAASRGGS